MEPPASSLFRSTTGQLLDYLQQQLPHLLAAAALLVFGLLVALALGALARLLARRVRRLFAGHPMEQQIDSSGMERLSRDVFAGAVFWVTMLFFLAAAAEVLGMTTVTVALAWAARFLPNLLAAVLVIAGGVILGRVGGVAAEKAASAAGVERAATLGRLVRNGCLVVAVLIALDQIGVDSTLLTLATTILFGSAMGGVALAFGLGAREEAGNIIAAHYVARSVRAGQRIRLGETEGRIIDVRANGLVLHTRAGRLLVPGRLFSEQAILLLEED